jgi:hypothetical protein
MCGQFQLLIFLTFLRILRPAIFLSFKEMIILGYMCDSWGGVWYVWVFLDGFDVPRAPMKSDFQNEQNVLLLGWGVFAYVVSSGVELHKKLEKKNFWKIFRVQFSLPNMYSSH